MNIPQKSTPRQGGIVLSVLAMVGTTMEEVIQTLYTKQSNGIDIQIEVEEFQNLLAATFEELRPLDLRWLAQCDTWFAEFQASLDDDDAEIEF